MVIYGQRTIDDRIAFGGRGAGYAVRFEDRSLRSSRVSANHDRIEATLRAAAAACSATQRSPTAGVACWASRATGVRRSAFDRSTGLAWAGGYVGEGVAAANLAGRTLADLITGRAVGADDACRGSTTGRVAGSPSRFAGSASTGRSALPLAPIASRPRPAARPASARSSTASPTDARGQHRGARPGRPDLVRCRQRVGSCSARTRRRSRMPTHPVQPPEWIDSAPIRVERSIDIAAPPSLVWGRDRRPRRLAEVVHDARLGRGRSARAAESAAVAG